MSTPEKRAVGHRDGSSRPLRVLVLIDFLSLTGGAERFALGLATHLPSDRFDVWVCSTRHHEPEAIALLEQAGIPHLDLARRGRWDVLRFRALLGLLRAERFDVLHAHMFGSNVWGVLFGQACRVPVIVAHEHNWSYSGEPVRVWIDRNVIGRLASCYVAVSRSNFERMVEIERIPPEKIVVLPTAYIPHPDSPPVDLRSELGLEPGVPLVATAANLRVEKALDVLIRAHAAVLRSAPNAHLVLVGDGTCRSELEQLTAELDLSGSVHFLGRRSDIDSILHDVDICAMSSDWEGMPLFALEAMAAGKPMVATSVGGLPEIVADGRTGLLVPPQDPAALAQALVWLIEDPVRREQLGAAGALALGDRTIERVAERFAELYEDLRARQAPARQVPAVARRAAGRHAGRHLPPLTRASAPGTPPAADVLILCYHACSPTWGSPLSVTPDNLRRQVEHLLGRGWRPATFVDAALAPPARRTFAVTFDDGFASVKHHALPILDALAVPATMFVPTAFPGGPGPLRWPGIEHWLSGASADELAVLSWDEIRELAHAGWEIGSHSHSHARLTLLRGDALARELAESRRILTVQLGRPCRSVAYPYGATDARVAAAAIDAGYVAGAALGRSLAPAGPARQPRVGIYQRDGSLKFRLKVARSTRLLRASPLLIGASTPRRDSAT